MPRTLQLLPLSRCLIDTANSSLVPTHTEQWCTSYSLTVVLQVSFLLGSLLLTVCCQRRNAFFMRGFTYTIHSYTCHRPPRMSCTLGYPNANNVNVLCRNSADHAFVKLADQKEETRLGRTHAWRLKSNALVWRAQAKHTIGLTCRSTFAIRNHIHVGSRISLRLSVMASVILAPWLYPSMTIFVTRRSARMPNCWIRIVRSIALSTNTSWATGDSRGAIPCCRVSSSCQHGGHVGPTILVSKLAITHAQGTLEDPTGGELV
ncbi:hypothetical protein PMIN01_05189 [Paraphaeosphaeria minitans]|uniref:Uncharacterized protein n=1 Tax=Paraphaeosphaeria minitans TaxID=565426 RepID=A0A9P6KSM5_9PLEO|nr:hypothetical protein PMIN01_05189 [Paraphaeosphaeria minitans]